MPDSILSPQDYARQILEGTSLEDKLLSSSQVVFSDHSRIDHYDLPVLPGRAKNIQFSEQQIKFPKAQSFHEKDKRALAIHFFANHELLAIEMMAAAILKFPLSDDDYPKVVKTLMGTIEDEQKHFRLYLKRMRELGIEFGDYPLNDFFWKQMGKLKNFAEFYALIAITFEGANLDFADFYQRIFAEVGDNVSSQVMGVVLEDEIRHVSFGQKWLKTWKQREQDNRDFWQYYVNLLPDRIDPARAKGLNYCPQHRKKAGLDDSFIKSLGDYKGDFAVTKRRQW